MKRFFANFYHKNAYIIQEVCLSNPLHFFDDVCSCSLRAAKCRFSGTDLRFGPAGARRVGFHGTDRRFRHFRAAKCRFHGTDLRFGHFRAAKVAFHGTDRRFGYAGARRMGFHGTNLWLLEALRLFNPETRSPRIPQSRREAGFTALRGREVFVNYLNHLVMRSLAKR